MQCALTLFFLLLHFQIFHEFCKQQKMIVNTNPTTPPLSQTTITISVLPSLTLFPSSPLRFNGWDRNGSSVWLAFFFSFWSLVVLKYRKGNVCLLVCLFVCLCVFVCLFVCLHTVSDQLGGGGEGLEWLWYKVTCSGKHGTKVVSRVSNVGGRFFFISFCSLVILKYRRGNVCLFVFCKWSTRGGGEGLGRDWLMYGHLQQQMWLLV